VGEVVEAVECLELPKVPAGDNRMVRFGSTPSAPPRIERSSFLGEENAGWLAPDKTTERSWITSLRMHIYPIAIEEGTARPSQ